MASRLSAALTTAVGIAALTALASIASAQNATSGGSTGAAGPTSTPSTGIGGSGQGASGASRPSGGTGVSGGTGTGASDCPIGSREARCVPPLNYPPGAIPQRRAPNSGATGGPDPNAGAR
ncbi:MAG: hypothetical protein ACM30I_08025 [Gemmatimonas sp.]